MFGKELKYNEKGIKRFLISIFGEIVIGRRLNFFYLKKYFNKIYDGDNILDAGCGYGQYSFYFSNKFPKSNIISLDYNSDLIKYNKIIQKKIISKNVEFIHGDLTKYNKKDYFNFIISLDVTHYVGAKDQDIFNNYFKSLKKNGNLFLTVPNYPIRKKYFKDSISKYSKSEIISILNKSGFKIEKIIPIGNGLYNRVNKISSNLSKSKNKFELVFSVFLLIFGIFLIKFDKFFKNKSNSSWLFITKK